MDFFSFPICIILMRPCGLLHIELCWHLITFQLDELIPSRSELHVSPSSSRSLSQGSTNATVLDVAQTGGHKKRVRRSSFLNAKKLYEDAQMARKVKQYLSNLELEMDEESLQTLSLQCEPATNTRESFLKGAANASLDTGFFVGQWCGQCQQELGAKGRWGTAVLRHTN